MTFARHLARAAIASTALLASACGGCGRPSGSAGEGAPAAAASVPAAGSGAATPKAAASASAASPSSPVDDLLWAHAQDGDEEDLAALAVHAGAAGLIAAASDPDRRPTALRAARFARGYAQVAWLADVADGASDEDAQLALEALADIGARVRRAEEHEDEDELREGCTRLASLARDAARPRARRIGALRAVRSVPCPKLELPGDLDAR